MAGNSWTREENRRFKDAVSEFTALSPDRFEKIAEYVNKPVADVKAHYKGFVDDLLGMGPSVWLKDEHEWFLIGLNRFRKDFVEIAGLLVSKNVVQVVIYDQNFCRWQNERRKGVKQRKAKDTDMVDMNVEDLMGQQAGLVQPELEPPQVPMVVLDIE